MKKAVDFARGLVADTIARCATAHCTVASYATAQCTIAVDATCGNGYDTLFLAEQVGSTGRVFAYDIQDNAISATHARLAQAGLLERVTLMKANHADSTVWPATLQAAMFNLGYLPGSDHSIKTLPETTIAALQLAISRLVSGGIVTVVIYTGHDGGTTEFDAVHSYCASLPQSVFAVLSYKMINQHNNPPQLIAITRL